MDMVKLLPGEKMIYKEKNQTIVLDSHSQQQRFGSDMFNPPKLDSGSNNNKILKSFKKKHLNGNINGMMQFPQFINPGQMNNMPNNMMMNMVNGNIPQGMNMNQMGMANFNAFNAMNNMNGMPNLEAMQNMGNNFNPFNGMNPMNDMTGMNANNENTNLENLALNHKNAYSQVQQNNNPNLPPKFSFKQTKFNNNPDNNMQKDFLDMKQQFSKMMV